MHHSDNQRFTKVYFSIINYKYIKYLLVYLHICGFISTFAYRNKVVRLTKPATYMLNQLKN